MKTTDEPSNETSFMVMVYVQPVPASLPTDRTGSILGKKKGLVLSLLETVRGHHSELMARFGLSLLSAGSADRPFLAYKKLLLPVVLTFRALPKSLTRSHEL